MPKIICGAMDCKWNGVTNRCKYQGTIKLTDCYMQTTHEGMQHFNKCKCYEQDESIEEMQKDIIKFFKEKGI